MATMWEPPLARAAASGPPVEPLTRREPSASQPLVAPGTLVATEPTAEIACMGRDAGPNQPRYAFTSRTRGTAFGSPKCSEAPTDTAGFSRPFTGNVR